MTRDEIEVVLKVRMSVYTGGLFENPGPGLVPTKPEDWAPTSDPGYTMKSAEVQVQEILMGKALRPVRKIGFWEWFWGGYSDNDATVNEIVSVKTLNQSYVSGE